MTASQMGRKGAKSRWAKTPAAERQKATSKAGSARWNNMTAKQRKAHIARMVAARQKKKIAN